MVTRRRPAEKNLRAYRRKIATVDQRIVRLLARRWTLVQETMEFKRSRQLTLFDATQEKRVLARARRWARALDLAVPAVDRLFRSIIQEGRQQATLPDDPLRPARVARRRRAKRSRRKRPGDRD
jgi:chorismate mutase